MSEKDLARALAMTSTNIKFIITKIQKNKQSKVFSCIDELQKMSNSIYEISQSILKTEKQNDKKND